MSVECVMPNYRLVEIVKYI